MPDVIPEGRLAVLMFTDIVGSVTLEERLGTQTYGRLRQRHNELFREAMRRYPPSQVIKNLGDGFYTGFERASDAVKAALTFQQLLRAEHWEPVPLGVGIGLDMGEVAAYPGEASDEFELVGKPVNTAARIASAALPGQILMSAAVFENAKRFVRAHPAVSAGTPPALAWQSHGRHALKGFEEPIELFEVGAEGASPQRAPGGRDKASGGLGTPGQATPARPSAPVVKAAVRAAPPTATAVPSAPSRPSALADLSGRSLAAGPAPDQRLPPKRSAKLFLAYKRNVQPDGDVLALLEQRLRAAGHEVFIDRHLQIGVEWAREIEQRIRESDAIIPLLSATSVNSEMLAYELQIASSAANENDGKPRILPVRLKFDKPWPAELAPILQPLQYFLWTGPADDQTLLQQLAEAIRAPRRLPGRPGGGADVSTGGGGMALDSPFYVVRRSDRTFHEAIQRRDAIVLLKGARQMGKTSLLARGLQQARDTGFKAVITDLQKLTAQQMETPKAFFVALGELLADGLDLDVLPGDGWNDNRTPNSNFERFLRREVLGKDTTPLLWALDEADRLFSCPFGGDVFALFRTWHNGRALDPVGPWGKLTLAIAYATEANLFITDPNQSPFNVGTLIALADFSIDQVADLNGRYGSPLSPGQEVTRLCRLVGGHPFLVGRALAELTSQSLEEFEARAAQEEGPFGDHLRRILVMLVKDARLLEVMRGVLRGDGCPDADSFYRLRTAGIIEGTGPRDVNVRCNLYGSYLRRHLL